MMIVCVYLFHFKAVFISGGGRCEVFAVSHLICSQRVPPFIKSQDKCCPSLRAAAEEEQLREGEGAGAGDPDISYVIAEIYVR